MTDGVWRATWGVRSVALGIRARTVLSRHRKWTRESGPGRVTREGYEEIAGDWLCDMCFQCWTQEEVFKEKGWLLRT